jgi:hypothetical protein
MFFPDNRDSSTPRRLAFGFVKPPLGAVYLPQTTFLLVFRCFFVPTGRACEGKVTRQEGESKNTEGETQRTQKVKHREHGEENERKTRGKREEGPSLS